MFKAILTALVYGYTIIIMLAWVQHDFDAAEIREPGDPVRRGQSIPVHATHYVGLICAFDLGDTEALSLMLYGMAGGVTSTFFTYVSRANVTFPCR